MSSFREVVFSHRYRRRAIPGTPFSIWPVYIGEGEYVIYYTFDDHRVEFVSILRSEDDFSP